jgi:hypothetical protein
MVASLSAPASTAATASLDQPCSFGLNLLCGGASLDHLVNDLVLLGEALLLVVGILQEIRRRLLVIFPGSVTI